jgi:hypothetical protein
MCFCLLFVPAADERQQMNALHLKGGAAEFLRRPAFKMTR